MDLIKERNKYKINGNMYDYRTLRNKVSKKKRWQNRIHISRA